MTLEKFLYGRSPEVKDLFFYLMDEPIVVKNSTFTNLKVFAMAHTAPYDDERVSSIFGLALKNIAGTAEIVVVEYGPFQSVTEEEIREEAWIYRSKFWFYGWIQNWLKSNPATLVEAGLMLGKFQTKQQ